MNFVLFVVISFELFAFLLYRNYIRNNVRNYMRNNTNDFFWYCSARKIKGRNSLLESAKRGWTPRVQPTKGYGAGRSDRHPNQVANFAT